MLLFCDLGNQVLVGFCRINLVFFFFLAEASIHIKEVMNSLVVESYNIRKGLEWIIVEELSDVIIETL